MALTETILPSFSTFANPREKCFQEVSIGEDAGVCTGVYRCVSPGDQLLGVDSLLDRSHLLVGFLQMNIDLRPIHLKFGLNYLSYCIW